MKQIPKKNYIILFFIILFTLTLTIALSNGYKSKKLSESALYMYSNKITYKEFDVYVTEHPDSIIYISNKYDNSNEEIELKLIDRLEKLNLKNYFVYINASNKLLNKINKEYKLKIDINKLPVILVILDNQVANYSYVGDNSNIDDIIDFGDFE